MGGSEKLVRELFAEAEAELAACGGDVRKSALHVIVIDEIDAVFRKRSVAEDSGEATRSSAVNQILAKMDGVNSLPNVLLIGMTNRPELLDEALLRPGRLEVQIEIPRPNREGRREILQIHFGSLRESGRLSQPLCHAIDGSKFLKRFNDGNMSKREMLRAGMLKELLRNSLVAASNQRIFDLACDSVTGGFSGKCYSVNENWRWRLTALQNMFMEYLLFTFPYVGADLAGLVRCAGSIALARARRDGGGVEGLLITLDDVEQALLEIKKK